MADPISQSIPPHGVPADVPTPPPATVPAFNGYGASLAPPPKQYFAQPNTPHHAPAHTAQPSGIPDNVKSANPTVTTKGFPEVPQTPETDDTRKADENFHNLSDQDLLKRGDEQLEKTKEEYTNYGQNSLAHKAREALKPFMKCANDAKANFPIAGVDWFRSSDELIESLKQLKLPDGTPEDLAVTIKFPGEEVISLIPPGDGLKTKNPTQIYECFVHALGVMEKMVADLNSGNDNALAQAEARFNDVSATLKAIREEIDRRKLNPSGSQLEYKFQEFKDKGITINAVADGREFAFYEDKFMRETLDTASKPEKKPDPALAGKPVETD